MPEIREVFEMVTREVEPDHDAWQQQDDRRRRVIRNRRIGAVAVAAALMAALVVFVVVSREVSRTTVPANRPSVSAVIGAPEGLALVGLDGTVRRELPLPKDAWMADLSPDGQEVVFMTSSADIGFCGRCSADRRLAAVPVGSSQGTFIFFAPDLDTDLVGNPVWSPDGTQIAFTADSEGNQDIFVATIGAREQPTFARATRLTSDPAVDEFPAWSPDGSVIFYDNVGSELPDSSGLSSTGEIWSVPVDGGQPKRLTHNRVPDIQPDVAADGTVAFWHDQEIWTMASNGQEQRRLETVSSGGFNPRWSPDGSMLALLRYDASERAHIDAPGLPPDLPLLDVIVVDIATGTVTDLGTRVASYSNPVSWTPDGTSLLINRYDR